MAKDLNVPIISDLIRGYLRELMRKFGYFCDIQHFKIIIGITTDNIILRCIVSRNFIQFLKYYINNKYKQI